MVADLVTEFIKRLAQNNVVDFNDPNVIGTPDRVARWVDGYLVDRLTQKQALENLFKAKFPSTYDEMVIVKGIHTFGLCPHHLLPVEMHVNIGYIPRGYALGLSKVARVAKLLSHNLVLQEQYCMNIAGAFEEYLEADSVGVHVSGRHFCMIMRGVEEKQATTITTHMHGAFKDDARTRSEFLSLIKE